MVSRLLKRLFALTIGINDYVDKDLANLRGAAGDADSIEQFLIEKGAARERFRRLRDEQATRSAIRRELTDLITNPLIEKDDPILIYFAGHGNNNPAPKEWKNWDNWVQCLVPYDFNQPDGNGGIIHGIPDRSLGTILHRIASAKGNNITVILDCCHSGSGTRDTNTLARSAPPSRMPMPANIDEDLFSGEAFSLTRAAHVLPKFRHHGIESHILLAACKPEEVAHESYGKGQFTAALLYALKSLDIGSVTYSELVRQFKVLPYQNPQCEGRVDRLLFSNDLRSMKGYYTAKLELVKDKATKKVKGATEKIPQLQVEAGLIHGITADALFDIWTGLPAISGTPLYTCKALKVAPLRTTLEWQGSLQPPQTFVAKPQKSTKPTLRYHASEDFKAVFDPLLESCEAQNLPFCLEEATKELADVSLSATDEGISYDILAPEELEYRCKQRTLESLDDIWDVLRSISSYYHHLRQDNPIPFNIKNRENQTQAFMSMFDVEVYKLDDITKEPASDNLNQPGKGVHIVVDDNDDDDDYDGDDDDDDDDNGAIYGFKITNASTFDVYPHLFYFNSHECSIMPFYQPINVGHQQVDQPLKAGQYLTIGWGAGGYNPQSFRIDEATDVENGFLKLYITQDYVNLDFIQQSGLTQTTLERGIKPEPQKNKSRASWGAIRIPFVLERKQEQGSDDGEATRGVGKTQESPIICLLGTNNAKAPFLHELSNASIIGHTESLDGVKEHKLSLKDGSKMTLVDIPAFEDPSPANNTALCRLLLRFFQKHSSTVCNALVFAYDISKPRVEQTDTLNFGLVKDLCGDAFAKNIAILTTNWRHGTPIENFERRENELCTRTNCSGLIRNGARLHQCTSEASALTLLSKLASQEALPLGVQVEAKRPWPITKTAIGATLQARVLESIEAIGKHEQATKQELEDASSGWDEPLPDDEVEAMKEDLQNAQKEKKMLRDILTRMESIALN